MISEGFGLFSPDTNFPLIGSLACVDLVGFRPKTLQKKVTHKARSSEVMA